MARLIKDIEDDLSFFKLGEYFKYGLLIWTGTGHKCPGCSEVAYGYMLAKTAAIAVFDDTMYFEDVDDLWGDIEYIYCPVCGLDSHTIVKEFEEDCLPLQADEPIIK